MQAARQPLKAVPALLHRQLCVPPPLQDERKAGGAVPEGQRSYSHSLPVERYQISLSFLCSASTSKTQLMPSNPQTRNKKCKTPE